MNRPHLSSALPKHVSDVETDQKKWTLKKIALLVTVAFGLVATVPAAAGTINYSQDFNSPPAADWGWPLGGAAGQDYWVSDTNYGVNDAYFGSGVLWYGGNAGGTATPLRAWRSFRTSGQLAAGESFSSVSLSGLLWNNAPFDDGRINSQIAILDDSGNGYAGVATYGGHMMYLYRVDAGVIDLTGLSGASYSSSLINQKTLSLSVQDGLITLTVAGAPLTASDTTYQNFSTILLGGQVVVAEQHIIDNVVFSGTLTEVPEPALLLPCLLGVFAMSRKRR